MISQSGRLQSAYICVLVCVYMAKCVLRVRVYVLVCIYIGVFAVVCPYMCCRLCLYGLMYVWVVLIWAYVRVGVLACIDIGVFVSVRMYV